MLRDLDDFRNQVRAGALTDAAHGYRGLDYLGLLERRFTAHPNGTSTGQLPDGTSGN